MKRGIHAVLLVAALLLALCAGCGNGQPAVTERPAETPSAKIPETTAPPTEIPPTEAPTEMPPTEEPISGETTVGTEEELLAALEEKFAVIHLSSDITISNDLMVTRPVTLDMGGHAFLLVEDSSGVIMYHGVVIDAAGCEVKICNGVHKHGTMPVAVLLENGTLTVDGLDIDMLLLKDKATVLNCYIYTLSLECGSGIDQIDNTTVERLCMVDIELMKELGNAEEINHYKDLGKFTAPYIVMPDGSSYAVTKSNADSILMDYYYVKENPFAGVIKLQ